ncbi:MAG: DUF4292 domain-containing protein [Desulfobacterales bacterium]|nr:DUF4292 domain-containing protein [Desulfobacterales bacterium]
MKTYISIIAAMICFSVFFFGCSIIKRPPSPQVTHDKLEAEELIKKLNTRNENLKTLKGLGKIKLFSSGKSQSSRCAWIAEIPSKIRFEIFPIAGQTAMSLADDGEWLYAVNHIEQKYYKNPSKNSNLKRIISLPIKLNEIILYLSGHIYIPKYSSISISKDNNMIILKGLLGNIIEKIYFSKDMQNVEKVEVFDLTGSLLYEALFDYNNDEAGFLIPKKIVFSNKKDTSVDFQIEKHWTNVYVSPLKFIIDPMQ